MKNCNVASGKVPSTPVEFVEFVIASEDETMPWNLRRARQLLVQMKPLTRLLSTELIQAFLLKCVSTDTLACLVGRPPNVQDAIARRATKRRQLVSYKNIVSGLENLVPEALAAYAQNELGPSGVRELSRLMPHQQRLARAVSGDWNASSLRFAASFARPLSMEQADAVLEAAGFSSAAAGESGPSASTS